MMIEINGKTGEGGGQILRTAVSLSALTGEDVFVSNIRTGRQKPGLKRSHLKTIQALAKLTDGRLEGDSLGSEEIIFEPGKIKGGEIKISIKTAGSITLVLHGLLLPALFAQKETKISFRGGATDTFFSPSLDHLRFVFLGILEKMGVGIRIRIKQRGFYPEGGAETDVTIKPVEKLEGLNLTKRGELKNIRIISGATEDLEEKSVAERQVSGAKNVLSKLKLPLKQKTEYYKAKSTGSQINIIAEMKNTVFGVDNLGKLGKASEQVGREAALEFLREVRSNACLDRHTADQILPYLAASRKICRISTSDITPHCRTNISVIQKFFDGEFKTNENIITWQPG